MKRWMLTLIGICLFALPVAAQTAGDESPKQAETTRQLAAEVKKLRIELLEQSVEFQQWKLQQIERELQQARAIAERLEGEQRGIEQELAALSSDRQKEGDSLRAETGRQLQRLQSRQQPVRERVIELGAQRNREETRLSQLSARLKAESAAAPK